GQAKLAHYGHVQGLLSRSVNRVPPHISKREGRWRGKGRRVEPCAGISRVRSKDGMACVVGADGILTQKRARVGGVAKHRNRKRETGLCLIDCRYPPVAS